MRFFNLWLSTILRDPLEQFEIFKHEIFWNNYAVIIVLNLVTLFALFSQTPISKFLITKLYVFFNKMYTGLFGQKHQEYFLFFFFIFLFLLINNVIGLLPYTYTLTSYFMFTTFLSFTVFFGICLIGLESKGLRFLSVFSPVSVPNVLYFFLVSIELISYFMRVISLSTRLFANMVAGHALIKILLGFAWVCVTSIGILPVFAGIILWGLIVVVTCLELFISFLQAYVFVFLSLIYLSEVIGRTAK